MSIRHRFYLLRRGLGAIRWSQLRFARWRCPACAYSLHVHLRADELAVRCLRCGASAVSQSIIDVISAQCPGLGALDGLELSARGTLARWLDRHVGTLTRSEYMPGEVPGRVVRDVRNEDVQKLSFEDACFDLVTSTEVFEHVAEDARGFAEVRRVLRPGGHFIFTVPLTGQPATHERALMRDGELVHLDTPEYHRDPFSGSDRVLCMRNYGEDILERLHVAGFAEAGFASPRARMFGYARRVVWARR